VDQEQQNSLTFPHCDSKVLHRPGECRFCDARPDWQELRRVWGIAYTGHSEETTPGWDHDGNLVEKPKIPCPSEWDRPVERIHAWYGNVPTQ
jgi:hypothetical protein